MLRKTLINLIVILIPGIMFSQQLNKDERLHIAFNNAMVIAGHTAMKQDGYDNARAHLDLYDQNGAGHLYLLRQFPFSSLLGHRIFICENSFSNIMGKDSIRDDGGHGLESYCFKQLDDKNYEITITRAFRNVEDQGDRRIRSLRIYIHENEPETFSFIWYGGEHKVNIKLIKTADGNIRAHRFYDDGRLQKKWDPVYFDQYGRITNWGITKYIYSADHNLVKRESMHNGWNDILTITSAKNGNVEYREYSHYVDGKIETDNIIRLKRGQLEEVPYFDRYKYDETSITGITKMTRYYLLFDRDDFKDHMICSYWRHPITKRAYAQEQVEQRRKAVEKAAKIEQYEQMISEYNARFDKMKPLYSKLKHKVYGFKELSYEYRSKYPYIYRTVQDLKENSYSWKNVYRDIHDVFTVLEWDGQMKYNYMIISEVIRQFLDDPATKKERKALERSLEASTRMQILTRWLQNRGCNILTSAMIEKPELTRKYKSYKGKIESYHNRFSDDRQTIIKAGTSYMQRIDWLDIPHMSEDMLCKCIKMQEFILGLICDDTMKEQRKKLTQAFKDAYSVLYEKEDTYERLLPILLEKHMRSNGIAIPDEKDIDKIKFNN